MANTLTDLIPTIYSALDVVSRELVGILPGVTLDANAKRAALNQTIRSFETPSVTSSNITPGSTVPSFTGQTIGNNTLTITKSKGVGIPWTGEEELSLDMGFGVDPIVRDQFAQAMRTLANEVEADLAALSTQFSRAYGTAGTTPFASDLSASSNVLKILLDNGAPTGDLHLAIDTTAGAKLRSLAQLTKVNEAGTNAVQSQGILIDLHNFKIRESAQILTHTKGTGTSYQTNSGTGNAIGDTVIPADTGSGTILAGDIVTFAADTANKYVVTTALSGGSFTIGAPGLRVAIPDGNAITVGNSFTANMAYARNAIAAAIRVPAMPKRGDVAVDSTIVTDTRSGISFEIRHYLGYHQEAFEVGLAWGVAMVKEAHTALLLG